MIRVLKLLLPPVVFVASLGVGGLLLLLKPSVAREEISAPVAVVEVIEAQARDTVAKLHVSGVVGPARQVEILPEVGGRVVMASDTFESGGRFAKGEVLARIDPRDYRVAVREAASRLRQSELELELEQGRHAVAGREWELLGRDPNTPEAELALRKPHLEVVEQSVEAARGGLQRAQLNLERATLRAPFDCLVVAGGVEVGQVVGPNTLVATLVGSEELWVSVSLPVDQLGMVEVPGFNASVGSSASVRLDLGAGTELVRAGVVRQVQGQLNPQTRTAELVVSVPHPFDGDGVPLLPGAYVDVEIDGRVMPAAITVPRTALRDGHRVWVVDSSQQLRARDVVVGWRDVEDVVLTAGLSEGDRVVVSPLALPIEGMAVRVAAGVTP